MNGAPDSDKLPAPTAVEISKLGNRVDRRVDADRNKLDPEIKLSIAKSIAIIAMLRFGVENGAVSQEELDAKSAVELARILEFVDIETSISVEALRRKAERDGSVSTPLE